MLSARQALAGVLSDLLPSHNVVPDDAELLDTFRSHHAPTLASPYAYAEPPVEIISNVPFVVGADAADSNDDGQVKARLVYHQVRDDHVPEGVSLKLCWKFDVPLEDNWYDVHVDSVSGEIVAAIDYVSDAPPGRSRDAKALKGGKQKPLPGPGKSTPAYTYSVFPFGINDPVSGNISSVTEPWDKVASPAGWHAFPDKANLWLGRDIKGVTSGNKVNNSTVKWTNATTTIGNNVFAQEDWAGQSQWLTNSRPENSSMIFDYEYGEPEGLRPQEYVDFAVTQLFYTSNMYHDLLYRLGFDEVSGNFQMENWGKGGRGGDAVLAYAQAGEGTNNANFATPPDGTQPRMRMYLWSTATPYRDGDLEAGIVIHEYSE
jgi:extracellular elastinolytic metalloproteinase